MKQDRKLRTSEKWLAESQQNLRESQEEGLKKDEKIKILEELYLVNKPLPKKPSRIKLFGEKIRIKFQQLVKKVEFQKQTMIAKIEVPVK